MLQDETPRFRLKPEEWNSKQQVALSKMEFGFELRKCYTRLRATQLLQPSNSTCFRQRCLERLEELLLVFYFLPIFTYWVLPCGLLKTKWLQYHSNIAPHLPLLISLYLSGKTTFRQIKSHMSALFAWELSSGNMCFNIKPLVSTLSAPSVQLSVNTNI